MSEVRVTYHRDGDSWWAESDDVPGFSAAADSLSELRRLVRDGLAFHLDDDSIDLRETMEEAGVVASFKISSNLPCNWVAGSAWGVSHSVGEYKIISSSGSASRVSHLIA